MCRGGGRPCGAGREGDTLTSRGIYIQAHGAVFFPDLLSRYLEVVTRFFFFFPKWKPGGICALKRVELAVGCRRFVYETP